MNICMDLQETDLRRAIESIVTCRVRNAYEEIINIAREAVKSSWIRLEYCDEFTVEELIRLYKCYDQCAIDDRSEEDVKLMKCVVDGWYSRIIHRVNKDAIEAALVENIT